MSDYSKPDYLNLVEKLTTSQKLAPAQIELFKVQGRQPRFVVKMDPIFGYLVWDNLRQKPVTRRRGQIRYFKKFDPANRRAEALNNPKGES